MIGLLIVWAIATICRTKGYCCYKNIGERMKSISQKKEAVVEDRNSFDLMVRQDSLLSIKFDDQIFEMAADMPNEQQNIN